VLHISKCAGTSVMVDISEHVRGDVVSAETCWDDIRIGHRRMVTFLRDPRSHVISQYYHCDMCAHTPGMYFRLQNWPDQPNMTKWLDHWITLKDNASAGTVADNSTFHCYLPIDLQVRQMSCKANHSFCPGQDDRALSDIANFGGSLATALSNLHMLAYVGIIEFYQESMCLIHVQEFDEFPAYCDCRDATAWGTFHDHHTDHGVAYHPSWSELTQSDIERIDKLTFEDWLLYTSAVKRFHADLQRVEQRFGKRILCDLPRLIKLSYKRLPRPEFFLFDDG